MTTPQPGDTVYLFSRDARIDFFGFVGDANTPNATWATMELVASAGTVTTPVLVGDQGPPGRDRPIVDLQFDRIVTDPADLPQLTSTPDDHQKAYIVGPTCYVWDSGGRKYHGFQIGVRGPAGPVPVLHCSVVLLDPEGPEETGIQQTGTPEEPGLIFRLKVPRGPVGPSTSIREAPDYDDKTPPVVGDFVGWNGKAFAPLPVQKITGGFYTVPQAQFQAKSIAVGAGLPIGSWSIPAQDYDWKPLYQGALKLQGVEVDLTPFQLRVEIRKDDPQSGQLVAVGFGTPHTFTQIVPHFATPSSPSAAVTPNNAVGMVKAGETSVWHANVANDGLLGVYHYEPDWTELVCQLVPMR